VSEPISTSGARSRSSQRRPLVHASSVTSTAMLSLFCVGRGWSGSKRHLAGPAPSRYRRGGPPLLRPAKPHEPSGARDKESETHPNPWGAANVDLRSPTYNRRQPLCGNAATARGSAKIDRNAALGASAAVAVPSGADKSDARNGRPPKLTNKDELSTTAPACRIKAPSSAMYRHV
jgi:hypothetical protein